MRTNNQPHGPHAQDDDIIDVEFEVSDAQAVPGSESGGALVVAEEQVIYAEENLDAVDQFANLTTVDEYRDELYSCLVAPIEGRASQKEVDARIRALIVSAGQKLSDTEYREIVEERDMGWEMVAEALKINEHRGFFRGKFFKVLQREAGAATDVVVDVTTHAKTRFAVIVGNVVEFIVRGLREIGLGVWYGVFPKQKK